LMNFANSSVLPTNAIFNASNYTGTMPNASGIFRLATGQYAVVLDGTLANCLVCMKEQPYLTPQAQLQTTLMFGL
jgi:hypothetical protein